MLNQSLVPVMKWQKPDNKELTKATAWLSENLTCFTIGFMKISSRTGALKRIWNMTNAKYPYTDADLLFDGVVPGTTQFLTLEYCEPSAFMQQGRKSDIHETDPGVLGAVGELIPRQLWTEPGWAYAVLLDHVDPRTEGINVCSRCTLHLERPAYPLYPKQCFRQGRQRQNELDLALKKITGY